MLTDKMKHKQNVLISLTHLQAVDELVKNILNRGVSYQDDMFLWHIECAKLFLLRELGYSVEIVDEDASTNDALAEIGLEIAEKSINEKKS